MPEPTDHRAEAEDWLHHAHEVLGRDAHGTEQVEARASAEYGRVARTFALIGIGHVLLALTEPQESEVITHTRCTTEVTFAGDGEALRCVRLPGHQGDHWLPFPALTLSQAATQSQTSAAVECSRCHHAAHDPNGCTFLADTGGYCPCWPGSRPRV